MRSREDGSSSSPGWARLASVASSEEPFDNGCHRRTVREINECGRAHLGENERVAAAAALRKHHLKFTKTKVGGRAEEGEPSVWKLATVEEALRPLPPTASSLRATLQHWGAGVHFCRVGEKVSEIHLYLKSSTEGCKKIKNRKPKLASERPSAHGRDFAHPIAYLFTHLSIMILES